MRLAAWLLSLTVALAGVQSASAQAEDPTIYFHYTVNCTFSAVGDNGAPISVIPPGRYQVVVTSPMPFGEPDLAAATDPNYACGHAVSFRLTGPGVSLHTTLEDGDAAFDQLQATFQTGTYVAQEDRRPTVARIAFSVSSGAPSTGAGTTTGGSSGGGTSGGGSTGKGTAANPTSLQVRGTLDGNVTTAGKLTLKYKGKTVSSLKAGRYKVTVLDETGKTGFSLQKLGVKPVKVTGPSFLGRHSVTVTLRPGQWFFYSTPGKKRYFVVTA
jgi:hypothetical protein